MLGLPRADDKDPLVSILEILAVSPLQEFYIHIGSRLILVS